MKRIALLALLALASANAFADSSYTCSGHGVTNMVEVSPYDSYIKINGIEFKPSGSGKDIGNGQTQIDLVSVYAALDGNHQIIEIYKEDFKHPLILANTDTITPVNGNFMKDDLISVSTDCPASHVKSVVHHKPKKKKLPVINLDDLIDNGNNAANEVTDPELIKKLNENEASQW